MTEQGPQRGTAKLQESDGVWLLCGNEFPRGLRVPNLLAHGSVLFPCRPSMSGLHLARRGREQKKVDLHRDFTVASPAEFVTRFGGHLVIEKVQVGSRHSGWGGTGQPASGCRERPARW